MLTVAGIISIAGLAVAAPILYGAWKRLRAEGDMPTQAELERLGDGARAAYARSRRADRSEAGRGSAGPGLICTARRPPAQAAVGGSIRAESGSMIVARGVSLIVSTVSRRREKNGL